MSYLHKIQLFWSQIVATENCKFSILTHQAWKNKMQLKCGFWESLVCHNCLIIERKNIDQFLSWSWSNGQGPKISHCKGEPPPTHSDMCLCRCMCTRMDIPPTDTHDDKRNKNSRQNWRCNSCHSLLILRKNIQPTRPRDPDTYSWPTDSQYRQTVTLVLSDQLNRCYRSTVKNCLCDNFLYLWGQSLNKYTERQRMNASTTYSCKNCSRHTAQAQL